MKGRVGEGRGGEGRGGRMYEYSEFLRDILHVLQFLPNNFRSEACHVSVKINQQIKYYNNKLTK